METVDTWPIQGCTEWGRSPEEVPSDLRSDDRAGMSQVRRGVITY